MQVNTILVPTDFSETAGAALETAASLAEQFGARLVILHAYHAEIPMVASVETPYALPPGFYKELAAEAQRRVDELARKTNDAKGIPTSAVAVEKPPATAIVEQAQELSADMIVMGTHGHTGIKHLLLGSVAERVVRTAHCPVLTVNPPRETE